MAIHQDIRAYNAAQAAGDKRICEALSKSIDLHLKGAENKIWHRHPVWFLDGNPIAGYSKLKDCIRLLFWSGQSFDEPGLEPEGTFKAAEARYTAADQIVEKELRRWLGKSIKIQWDYKNLIKRKGRLEWLKGDATSGKKSVGAKPDSIKTSKPGARSKGAASMAVGDADADWRGQMLDRVRSLIKQADPDAIEEVKWRKPSNNMRGVPVWSDGGIICTGETYKNYVKLTFARGASLDDPTGLFNASLEGGTRRAIDLHEGDALNEKAFKALVRAAAELNQSSAPRLRKRKA